MSQSTNHSPTHTPVTLAPMDVHNQALIAAVHPPDWTNPPAAACYDLVVIGAGTAGLVTAAGAAGLGLGLKVALIERHLMGGDCLNVGCVPSKCLIRSSRVIGDMQQAKPLGVTIPNPGSVDFGQVMERMRRIRAGISHHDSAERFRKIGIDVFLGNGQFVNSQAISVNGQTLRFKKAVIATGARAARPDIPGLKEAGYLTNETVFSLTECPRRLAVIGAGPIGVELAQAFCRLGAEVVLFERSHHILVREDRDAAEIVQNALIRDGVQIVLNSQLLKVQQTSTGKVIEFTSNGKPHTVVVDEILVGAGRSPNVEGLNLEGAGVNYSPRQGVIVNDYMQTTCPHIYAAGDICMAWKFTHAADAAARIVIKNALFAPFGLGRSRLSDLIVPWCTYSDPEVAHVGLYEEEAQAKGLNINTIKIPFTSVDRAIADGEEEGFVKILHKKGSDQILGATIVARHAGDMISEVTLAMVAGKGLNTLSTVIHPYPTQAEGIRKAADAYRRTLLTPRTKTLLGLLTRFS